MSSLNDLSKSPSSSADQVRLGEHRVPPYDGEIMHTFGEGYNRDYTDHMDLEFRCDRAHESSLKARAAVADFESKFAGPPWVEENREAARAILTRDLSLAVNVALGHTERQKAERHLLKMETESVMALKESYKLMLENINTIFETNSDPGAVLTKLKESVEEKGEQETQALLRKSPELFGDLKGREIEKGKPHPEGFERGAISGELMRIIEDLGERARITGVPDQERVEALRTLTYWTIDLGEGWRSTLFHCSFVNTYEAAAPAVELYLKNPEGVSAAIETKEAALEQSSAALEKKHAGDLGNIYYPDAVIRAMKQITVHDCAERGISVDVQQEAARFYELAKQGEIQLPER